MNTLLIIHMANVSWKQMAAFATFIVLLIVIQTSAGSKILVGKPNPMSPNSHNAFMSRIMSGLRERGHHVTLLTSSNKQQEGFSKECYSDSVTYDVSLNPDDLGAFQSSAMGSDIMRGQGVMHTMKLYWNLANFALEGCKTMFQDTRILDELKEQEFDILLVTMFIPCDALLAQYLNLPFIVVTTSLRFPLFHEDIFGVDTPSSYVPFQSFGTCTSDMTFQERVGNILHRYILSRLMFYVFMRPYSKLQIQNNPTSEISISELLGKAELWLCQTDFALDFPRPTAPNWIHIGGLKASHARVLSQDLEDFVQGSGEHGVIVFSLGSMVTSLMNEDLNDLFAEVFSELPQRVLWRFVGSPPRHLGNNTRLMEWLPQNDLLGHPKTRLLIYHGGINGVYEAMYHKVPMVLLPIFADQPAIGARVAKKGMGLVLDRTKLTHQSVKNAITEVLNNPSYKANVEKYGSIHRDSLASPLDTAVFWIEHVLKFGGGHLKSRATELNFFVLNSLDVIAFLLLMSLVILYINYLVIRTCYRCTCGKKTLKAKSE